MSADIRFFFPLQTSVREKKKKKKIRKQRQPQAWFLKRYTTLTAAWVEEGWLTVVQTLDNLENKANSFCKHHWQRQQSSIFYLHSSFVKKN